MKFFDRIKEALKRNPEVTSVVPKPSEVKPETGPEAGAKSPEQRLKEGQERAQNTYDEIKERNNTAYPVTEEEKAKEPEGRSMFQKVTGWFGKKIESFAASIDEGVEASEILDAMDYAKKIGLDLRRKVDLNDPAVKQTLIGLKGYKGQAVSGLIAGIKILEEFRGYRNKLEAVRKLKDLQEQALAGANAQTEFNAGLQGISKDFRGLADAKGLAVAREEINS